MILNRPILLFGLLTLPIFSMEAQDVDYGVVLIYNSSSQTNTDPTIPEDGTTQWNALGTWGGGGFIKKSLLPKFDAQLALLFQQKGYKELAQVGLVPGGPVYDYNLRNTFNYLSADMSIRYKMYNANTFGIGINLGLEYNYLLNYTIRSDTFPINMFYPVNAYQDQWEKSNLSIIPSVSFTFDPGTTFEFGFNGSLTPVLKAENLIVKDWIWTVRLSQSIPALFRKSDK